MSEAEEPFNLVPLTDMVFNLLIFFMCATTFAQIEKDVSVQLPQGAKFQTLSEAPAMLTVNIRRDGTLIVNDKQYPLGDVRKMVLDLKQKDANGIVLVRCDNETLMKYFAGVSSEIRAAGLNDIRIAYTPSEH